MHRIALLVLALVASSLLGAAPANATPTPTAAAVETRRERVVVVRVSDGDTLRVLMPDGTEEYVRLLGIDTPEVYPRRECGGPQATRAMRRLAPEGSSVVIVPDPSQGDRDRYGRLLRYVQRSGKDVGRAQVVSGRAQVYVYRNDPFDRVGAYQRAQRRAEKADRGSWARCWR